ERVHLKSTSSLLKNPRQNESSLIQFFNHESVEASMRGAFTDQGQLFSYISPEARVRTDHPLRKIRKLVRDVLGELSRSLSRLYASEGRPSIPPEQLLSALLLQVFYGIRSERQLMEQLDYTIFCTAGSWDFRPTTWCGTRPCSRRIATGCRAARYSPSS